MWPYLDELETMVWTVREATPEDAPNLLDYMLMLAAEPGNNTSLRPGTMPASVDATVEMIAHHQRGTTACLYVVEAEGGIVGMLKCVVGQTPVDRHMAELSLNLRADYRGEVIGYSLMEQALDWARGVARLQRLQLRAFARDEDTIALCERFGFHCEGYLRAAYYLPEEDRCEDGILMAYLL